MTRILCLDDEPAFVDLYRLILESRGYEVVVTTSSHEALELLHAQPIDLLIQDCMRPEMTGAELLRRVKNDPALANLRVILLTAGNVEQRIDILREVGLDFKRDVQGFIRKPVTPQELIATVERVLSQD
jgi:CheY-like chemotaxis protein